MKVLIVDDEEELRTILSEQLRQHGLEILLARTIARHDPGIRGVV